MSRLSPVSCSLQMGRKETEGCEKTQGGGHGGGGTQTLLETPDSGNEKMSTRWEQGGEGAAVRGKIRDG